MSTVVQEPRTLTLPDITTDLVNEVESAAACQFNTCCRPPEDPCPNEAAFIIYFKDRCDHGGVMKAAEPLICGAHTQFFVKGDYNCGACGCDISLLKDEDYHHIIARIEEIPT